MAAEGTEIVERLAAHQALQAVPRAELEWLAARGELRSFDCGQVVSREGEAIEALYVVLSGRFDIRVQRGATVRRVMEWRGGDISGLLPFSRMRGAPGDTTTREPTELFSLDSRHFPELIRECQTITAICVHVMVDRARHFRASDLQDEKLSSLGRLAAGLAHELNNPASAVARNAATLVDRLPRIEIAFSALGGSQLTAAERALFDELRGHCADSGEAAARSPLDQAERVEELGAWLERHGVDAAEAEPLSETSVTVALLDRAAKAFRPEALVAAICALAAGCGTRHLAEDIESAATRVHELVAAVKGFTYMDQAQTPKPVDLTRGLADTMTVLRSKAKSRSVRIVPEFEPGLPTILGLGGELNQVWANLIDNAIDASPEGGTVSVAAARVPGAESVTVRVVDGGAGIPSELKSRVFEPFFTTKPVGSGTGLGLALARNLVSQHGGEIEIDSRPGRTELRVTLPIAPENPAAT